MGVLGADRAVTGGNPGKDKGDRPHALVAPVVVRRDAGPRRGNVDRPARLAAREGDGRVVAASVAGDVRVRRSSVRGDRQLHHLCAGGPAGAVDRDVCGLAFGHGCARGGEGEDALVRCACPANANSGGERRQHRHGEERRQPAHAGPRTLAHPHGETSLFHQTPRGCRLFQLAPQRLRNSNPNDRLLEPCMPFRYMVRG